MTKKMALKENFYRQFLYTISDNIEVCIVLKLFLIKYLIFFFSLLYTKVVCYLNITKGIVIFSKKNWRTLNEYITFNF